MENEIIKLICNWLRPRTVFALMFYSVVVYMEVKQIPVSDFLQSIVLGMLGFYFGSKVKAAKTAKEGGTQ